MGSTPITRSKEVLYRLSYMGFKLLRAALPKAALKSQLERVMGIEPTLSAWKAEVLPLNYTRTNSANISHLNLWWRGEDLNLRR